MTIDQAAGLMVADFDYALARTAASPIIPLGRAMRRACCTSARMDCQT